MNALEGGAGSLVFSTGMAAITTALQCFLKAGDHVVQYNTIYSTINQKSTMKAYRKIYLLTIFHIHIYIYIGGL